MDPPRPGPGPAPRAPGADTGSTAGSGEAVAVAPQIKRRAPIACRRCRRMRSKCIHDKAQPPCKPCFDAGVPAEECEFPQRGLPDSDRQYRHPRARAAGRANQQSRTKGRSADTPVATTAANEWQSLPPLEDLTDGVDRFIRHYFQLGFIPKDQYRTRMRDDYRSLNLFLLLSILSISARLSPPLKARYGGSIEAAKHFTNRASNLALSEVYETPTLERCQAFYLLSLAQQGNGESNKSYINMGISLRMAALLRLHREETYHIPNANPESIIRAESARRTLWMLHSQDSLHSGPHCPVSLAASDITALLPSHEEDFAAGREPRSRAALHDTPPAKENPNLICDNGRSLFASLMQVHHFWGIVGRRAIYFAHTERPWEPTSEFSTMVDKLRSWEHGLPLTHRWDHTQLQMHKADGHDLAYLGVTMMPRLCHIVLRRPYLDNIINMNAQGVEQHAYFANLSLELFTNVRDLFIQINAQFTNRNPDESVGAQMAAFCVYSCGLFSAYLIKYPNICALDQSIADLGSTMFDRTVEILMECKQVWPLAGRWLESLEKFSLNPDAPSLATSATMADGKDTVPHVLRASPDPSRASDSTSPVTIRTSRRDDVTRDGSQPSTRPSSLSDKIVSPKDPSSSISPFSQQFQAPVSMLQHQQAPPTQPYAPRSQQPLIPSQQAFPQPQMYMAPQLPPGPAVQPADTRGMLISSFNGQAPNPGIENSQTSQLQPAFPPADPNAPPYSNDGPATIPFFPGFGPRTDGFNNELEFYFTGGVNPWEPSPDWTGEF